jgi:hypothetical protein
LFCPLKAKNPAALHGGGVFGNIDANEPTLKPCRRAAKQQRVQQQSQVKIARHGSMDTPQRPKRQIVFQIF